MKKQVCGILAAFGLMFFLLSAVYYFSYQDLKEQQREELAEGEENSPRDSSETESGKIESGIAGAAKLQELTVSMDMRYVCQSYDPAAGERDRTAASHAGRISGSYQIRAGIEAFAGGGWKSTGGVF